LTLNMKQPDQMGWMPEERELWKTILADVREKTGLSFNWMEFDTKDKTVAHAVLPILATWVATVPSDPLRHAIYTKFSTPHAYPFINQLIEWWQREDFELCVNSLTQTISSLAKELDAQRIWNVLRARGKRRSIDYLLLVKLCAFPKISKEVKDLIVDDIHGRDLRAGDLQEISKVDDPRIRDWFESQINSSNRHVQVLARRIRARRMSLPSGVELSKAPPDRARELFSTEVDLDSLITTLSKLHLDMDIEIPQSLGNLGFLSSIETNRWLKIGPTKSNFIWLRLEDVDTVELVITAL